MEDHDHRRRRRAFCLLDPLPPEDDESPDADEKLEGTQRLLHAIEAPVTDEAARLLPGSFGHDNAYGLAWTLLHLIESAPSLAAAAEPPEGSNQWHVRMWTRYQNYLADQHIGKRAKL